MKDFEIIPHTADIKIRAFGATKQELFRNALVGMFQSIGPQAAGCNEKDGRLVCSALPEQHNVSVGSPDLEALLVDFLSEALYLSDVFNEAYLDTRIHNLSDTHVEATLYGIKVTGFEVVEIKAVTYHELAIQCVNDVWRADVVFDI